MPSHLEATLRFSEVPIITLDNGHLKIMLVLRTILKITRDLVT